MKVSSRQFSRFGHAPLSHYWDRRQGRRANLGVPRGRVSALDCRTRSVHAGLTLTFWQCSRLARQIQRRIGARPEGALVMEESFARKNWKTNQGRDHAA